MQDVVGPPAVQELSIIASAAVEQSPIEGFLEACAPIFSADMADRGENTSFSASLTGVQFGAMVLSQTQMSGGHYAYRRDMQHIATSGLDLIFVQIITGGSDLRLVGGEEVRSRPGDVFVADLTRTMQTQTENCANFSFVLPRAAFGLREAEIDRLHDRVLPGDSMGARLLNNHIGAVWGQRHSIGQADIPPLSAATAGLLGGLLQAGPADRGDDALVLAPKYLQICQYIDHNIGLAALDPDHLAQCFNVSRAVLYRLFQHNDGVANYIRDRRLRRAFRQLMAPNRGGIAAIGYACGFASASSFIRAFKAKYGMTPGEASEFSALRGALPPDPPQLTESAVLRAWLESADRGPVSP